MKISRHSILLISCTLLLINGVYAANLQNELAKTEEIVQQAKSVGSLWRDTEKLVAKAKKLIQTGKHDDAAALLYEARQQAELAYHQTLNQAEDKLIPHYLLP